MYFLRKLLRQIQHCSTFWCKKLAWNFSCTRKWRKFLACMSSALIVSSPCYSNLSTKKWGCTVSNYQLPLCPTVTVCTTTFCGVFVLNVHPRYSVTVTTTKVSISKYRFDIDTFSEKYRYRYRRYFWKVSLTTLLIIVIYSAIRELQRRWNHRKSSILQLTQSRYGWRIFNSVILTKKNT